MYQLLKACLIACAVLSAAVVSATSAQAGENRLYFSPKTDPRLPDCTAGSVHGAVKRRFNGARKSYSGGVKLVSIESVREVRYQADGVSPVARRYCRATATLSDGSDRPVFYMVEELAGIFGIRWNVEACVPQFDKWRVYGGYCNTTRPR